MERKVRALGLENGGSIRLVPFYPCMLGRSEKSFHFCAFLLQRSGCPVWVQRQSGWLTGGLWGEWWGVGRKTVVEGSKVWWGW